jgi:hypothetical protein
MIEGWADRGSIRLHGDSEVIAHRCGRGGNPLLRSALEIDTSGSFESTQRMRTSREEMFSHYWLDEERSIGNVGHQQRDTAAS